MPESRNGHDNTQDLLDRMLEGKSDAAKARVFNLVYRLRMNANDPLFLVMIAMGYLQTLIEDSPEAWEETFDSFKNELDEWTQIHLKTLESLARKSESEKSLAETSTRLGLLLEKLLTQPNISNIPSRTPTPDSPTSKAISHIPELLEASRSMERQVQKLTTHLPRLLLQYNKNMTARVSLPAWLAVILTVLSFSSVYNFMTLQSIRDAVLHPPPVSSERR